METQIIFSPLETREPLSKLISNQIEKAIFEKKYPPGSKLPSENEMCEQFGVSRTSVREALGALEAQGIIEIIKGKGMFVSYLSPETVTNPLQKYLKFKTDRNYVMDLVHARQIIEPAIAYHAAINHTDLDIAKLDSDIRALKESDGNFAMLASIDTMFHLNLAKASKNRVIPLLLSPIHDLIPEVKSSVYASVTDAKASAVIWHEKIFDAVVERNAEKAKNAMEEHLLIAEQHAEKMLELQK